MDGEKYINSSIVKSFLNKGHTDYFWQDKMNCSIIQEAL